MGARATGKKRGGRSDMRKNKGTRFSIDRKIFTSDIWSASPWKLKIWLYLIGKANWGDSKQPYGLTGIKLKRGQTLRSYRQIAKDCAYKIGYRTKKPSLATIRRICEELTKEQRITHRTEQSGTLFTILNYNALQPPQKCEANGELEGGVNGSETAGEHYKKNNIEEEDNKQKVNTIGGSPPPFDRFVEIWNAMAKATGLPAIVSKSKERRDKFNRLLKDEFFRDNWCKAIGLIPRSDFLTGATGWKANIKFFLTKEGVAKIIEGNYRTAKPVSKPGVGVRWPDYVEEDRTKELEKDRAEWAEKEKKFDALPASERDKWLEQAAGKIPYAEDHPDSQKAVAISLWTKAVIAADW